MNFGYVAFWLIPLPLVAFRDLLADPLPPPNWLRGFWMPPYGMIRFDAFERGGRDLHRSLVISLTLFRYLCNVNAKMGAKMAVDSRQRC